MSLGSVITLSVIWLAMFKALTSESFYNDGGNHRGRHKYKRHQLFAGENNGNSMRFQPDNLPLQEDPSLLLIEDENEAVDVDPTFEMDKPLPIEQVAVPVGGKACLPCDTRYTSGAEDHGKPAADSSGFFMVMWFKEQSENDPADPGYEQAPPSSSTSGEPIFTYDIRQSMGKNHNPPRWVSSPLGFGDRAYFHSSTGERAQNDQEQVDHLTVDRAMATDTGIYRCRIDFLKAPTRNRLVNLTVIVAPDRPKIYFQDGNAIGRERQENYQQVSGNMIVVDEGSEAITLICRVIGGWPRPRLTWYNENTVLDSTYQLLIDDDNSRGGYGKKQNSRSAAESAVTVNSLLLTNLTRWHSIMSQRQRSVGTARLTCQASNSITAVSSGGFSHPAIIAGNGNLPPPATTEHTLIRLNLKPTEVQIVSVKGIEDPAKTNESRSAFDKNEAIVTEDAVGHKKYTIRADRMYRAECRSRGSRPLATVEWYLIKKNQRYNIGRSAAAAANGTDAYPGVKLGSSAVVSEGAIVGAVETQQTSVVVTDNDEMAVTTSILKFMIRGPISALVDENDYNESTLVCRAHNPAIKTSDRHYVETKITLDVQYPPVVELRFGNRMLDTSRIGPGDDVYFECVARANPSTTIRYTWYHNGARLVQDAEKRRTDEAEKKGEKGNSRLASRVIHYSQLGSLVLQSVKAAAAGKYACQATNGIDNDSNENKSLSNTVRLNVKHVPVCQHREDMLIVKKKTDSVTGPAIRCRTGRGHPPTVEYQWKFYPEQAEPETRDGGGGPLESNEMALAGRSARQLDSLLTETAVPGAGDGGISYTFTTSTPVLKSYVSAVAAAASASSNAVLSNFLHGRLECRAVNPMGVQVKPCVYRITDKTVINQAGGRDHLQEITDCRPVPRNKGLAAANNTTAAAAAAAAEYPCDAKPENVIGNAHHHHHHRKTRFCITCSLNMSFFRYHQLHQRFSYVLQLYKTNPAEPTTLANAFNVTGVTVTEDGGGGKGGPDDGDYYFDSDGGDDVTQDVDRAADETGGGRPAIRKVVFVIDDSVDPGMYRGRIYNGEEGTVSAVVKGMINVAAVAFDDNIANGDDSDNYIIDEIENETDESLLGYAWDRVTVALVDMFSAPSPSQREPADRGRRPPARAHAASSSAVVLAAVLVAVVAALSCGIMCSVAAILYRRHCGGGGGGGGGERGRAAYGLECNGGGGGGGGGAYVSGGVGGGGECCDQDTGKAVAARHCKAADGPAETANHRPQMDATGPPQDQRRSAADAMTAHKSCRTRTAAADDDAASVADDDVHAELCAPLLRPRPGGPRPQCHRDRSSEQDETRGAGRPRPSPATAAPVPAAVPSVGGGRYVGGGGVVGTEAVIAGPTMAVKHVIVQAPPGPGGADGTDSGGPDIVMSTAATLANNHHVTDRLDENWQQQHQLQQMKCNSLNSNHQWSLYRLQYQTPNSTVPHPRVTLTTTKTPTSAVFLTNKHTKFKTTNPITDKPQSIPPQVLLNALHRESSI